MGVPKHIHTSDDCHLSPSHHATHHYTHIRPTSPMGILPVGNRHPHTLGKVPVMAYTTVLFNKYFDQPSIDDVLTIHDAVLHSESELVTNILKQTYGQLVLPASTNVMAQRIKSRLVQENPNMNINDPQVQAVIRQEVNLVLSRTKHLTEDSDERGTARYIQPAGANIETIIKADDRLVNMIIKLYGLLQHTTSKLLAGTQLDVNL